MFKNLILYRFKADAEKAIDLSQFAFVPCGASQDKSTGFVPPRGEAHGALVEHVDGHSIIKLCTETKKVPSDALRRAVDERIAQIEEATGRKPGKKERREIMDNTRLSMLPNAIATRSHTLIWLNHSDGIIAIDTTSQGKADDAVAMLLNAGNGLTLSLIQTVTSPQAAMTQWLLAPTPDEWPADLSVERECILKSVGEDAATVKFSRHHLANDDVRKHVTEGKLPEQLAMSWDGRMAFTLTQSLKLKKLHFLDGVFDAGDKAQEADRFDADVALSTGILTQLIKSLVEALGGEMKPA